MNILDFVGAALSLSATYYFTQAKRCAWLIGLCATILNMMLYCQKGIYGHLCLEAIYSISMLYGWFQWQSGKAVLSRSIRALTWKEGAFYSALAYCGIVFLGKILIHYTDSEIPYWDATSTILSLLAQWMLCLKIIHCWLLWFIVDTLIASLQYYKGIPFHSAAHWIYLSMAILGYWQWKQIWQKQKV